MNSGSKAFVRKAYIYLLFYVFWEFLVSSGRLLGSAAFKYLSFIVTFSIFLVCLSRTKRIVTTTDFKVWTPFLWWTIIGAFVYIVPGIMFIWATAYIVALIAIGNNMKGIFPFKLIFVFGLIQISGQLLQIASPSVYNEIIGILFNQSYKWYSSGLQGFTTNPGTISAVLIFALGSYLYFIAPSKNSILNVLVVAAVVLFIFLTGKRSVSFLALLLPLMTFFFSTKSTGKLVKYGVPLLLIVGLSFYLFVQNVEMFSSTIGLKKISRGVEMFIDSDGEVDLNGREILWEKAIQGYQENPWFGIGVSQFKDWSGLETNAHNMYLQVLCEQGIIGFALFVLPLFYCLLHTILLLRKSIARTEYIETLKYSLYIQLFFIIYGFSGNPTRNPYGYMMYFCAIGLLQSFQYRTIGFKLKRVIK